MSNRAYVEAKRTIPTYTTLRAVSWYAFQLAKADERARLNHLMTSMVFAAFTLEAYLNHVGSIRIKFWPPLKRKLGPRQKLEVITADLSFTPDMGTRPWQTFKSIFKLRDLLVHAQTETLPFEGEVTIGPTGEVPVPLTVWEEFMTMELGQRFLDDTKSMITELAGKADLPDKEIFAKDSIEAAVTPLGQPEETENGPA